MAAFAPTITPSLMTKLPCNGHRSPPLIAGANLNAGDACYINTDGTILQSIGTAANAAAQVDGFTAVSAQAGQPVTLYSDVLLAYGPSTATPGTKLYLSGTVAGGLDTAASTGGTAPVGKVVSIYPGEGTPHACIRVWKSTY